LLLLAFFKLIQHEVNYGHRFRHGFRPRIRF
jgi:hypothetical protein